MPTDLELAGQRYVEAERKLALARIARNRAIVAAHANGVGQREIGRRAGIDHSLVARIVAKGSPTEMDTMLAVVRGGRLEIAELRRLAALD